MKKLGIFLAVVSAICFWAFVNAHAVVPDSTKAISEMVAQGRHAAYLVGNVLDYNGEAVSNQLKRRILSVDLPKFGATVESLFVPVGIVPTGQTWYLHGAKFEAFTEVDAETTQAVTMGLVWYDYSEATQDTVVTPTTIDNDSVAYNLTAITLTRLDTIFTAGDAIWVKLKQTIAAASVPMNGGCVTLDITIDE